MANNLPPSAVIEEVQNMSLSGYDSHLFLVSKNQMVCPIL